jgi:hypothetical protein
MVWLLNNVEWKSKVLQDNFGDDGVVFVFIILGQSVFLAPSAMNSHPQ